MRLLDRYIAREALKILLLCLVLFMGVYVIVDLFEKFSRFIEAQVQPTVIARYYLFRLPRIFTEVMPVAVLLSCLLSLGSLARHNEILAMRMGHISSLRIALPCLGIGLAASLAAWTAAEHVVPPASEQAMNIERVQVKRLPAYRTTQDSDIWYRAGGNRFVHISLIEAQSGLIQGMSVFDLTPEFELTQRVDARNAVWGEEGWRLRQGYRLALKGEDIQVEPFPEMVVPLAEHPEDFMRVARSPEEMTYTQLRTYIERLESSGVSATRYRVDLHAKLSVALASLVMALIGVSFGLRTGKAGVMLWVGACIPMGFLYWMLLSLGFAFGRGGALPPLVAAWIPNLVFGTAGLVSLLRLRG